MSMTRTALRYCLDFEAVSVVIPGARRVQQVLENSGVSGQPPLPEALHSRLREFYAEEVAAHIRGPY
jgi:aryl-alcohol dehydrogenase-like predicted oxidoreductase